MDIIDFFPNANELEEKKYELSQYVLKKELESIISLFLWGINEKIDYIYIGELSQYTINFLEEKNYKIEKMKDGYKINLKYKE